MDWAHTTEGDDVNLSEISQSIRVLREPPARVTDRVAKLQPTTIKNAPVDQAIAAFITTKKGADPTADLRCQIYRRTWAKTCTQLEELEVSANEGTFNSLHAYILSKCAPPAPGPGSQRLPAALVSAGGFSSSDHVLTFQRLVDHLRHKGCHAALLTPRELQQGVSCALNGVMRGLSRLETAADDLQAILAWYQEQHGTSSHPSTHACQAAAAAAAVPPSSSAAGTEEGGTSPGDAVGGERAQQGGAAGGASTSAAGAAGAVGVARELRKRTGTAGKGAASSGGGRSGVGKLPPQPVVVVVQDGSSADPQVLRDLVATFSLVGACPVLLSGDGGLPRAAEE